MRHRRWPPSSLLVFWTFSYLTFIFLFFHTRFCHLSPRLCISFNYLIFISAVFHVFHSVSFFWRRTYVTWNTIFFSTEMCSRIRSDPKSVKCSRSFFYPISVSFFCRPFWWYIIGWVQAQFSLIKTDEEGMTWKWWNIHYRPTSWRWLTRTAPCLRLTLTTVMIARLYWWRQPWGRVPSDSSCNIEPA